MQAECTPGILKKRTRGARHDVWVSSCDEPQTKLYLEDCKYWPLILHNTVILRPPFALKAGNKQPVRTSNL